MTLFVHEEIDGGWPPRARQTVCLPFEAVERLLPFLARAVERRDEAPGQMALPLRRVA